MRLLTSIQGSYFKWMQAGSIPIKRKPSVLAHLQQLPKCRKPMILLLFLQLLSEMELLKGRIFLGTCRHKQEFLAHSENASIIHLATHAWSTPESPEEGFYSILSFPGKITCSMPEELYQLDLRQAFPVFLGACDPTGVSVIMEKD